MTTLASFDGLAKKLGGSVDDGVERSVANHTGSASLGNPLNRRCRSPEHPPSGAGRPLLRLDCLDLRSQVLRILRLQIGLMVVEESLNCAQQRFDLAVLIDADDRQCIAYVSGLWRSSTLLDQV
ncbi:hypothetical protein HC251_25105 (plasmid) [Iamia sp. SCSIO 61187]|uniref:hypothetical protein n=1 Tax=Iamia sp. SCSIO 61187 TaxID=2722752 RepID=UPI001C6259DA|nr:hypothetical protein [Iamia sp. SCSIO 61187]QYG95866.1 hypothetical protein HC251_25105 [Iamia sp. SCSIO 61187]